MYHSSACSHQLRSSISGSLRRPRSPLSVSARCSPTAKCCDRMVASSQPMVHLAFAVLIHRALLTSGAFVLASSQASLFTTGAPAGIPPFMDCAHLSALCECFDHIQVLQITWSPLPSNPARQCSIRYVRWLRHLHAPISVSSLQLRRTSVHSDRAHLSAHLQLWWG